MITTPGKTILTKLLPEAYNKIEAPLDAKGVDLLFTRMAKELPGDEYARVLKRLNNFGNKVAVEYGDVASIHLEDLRLPPTLAKKRKELKRKINNIVQNPNIPSEEKKKLVVALVRRETASIDKEVIEEMNKTDNSFGLLVKTKARGNPQQLRQLVFGDLLTVDSKMRDIPYPTLRSYGEGVTPLQYWAASHGGRQGYWLVQKATADAGYFSKQLRGTVHRQIVTADDCGNPRKYIVSGSDDDNVGSLLFGETKGKSGKVYAANTPITEDMIEDLPDKIAIRSAVTCTQGDGVCAKCAGIRESGKFSDIGDPVGLNGVNSFLEGLTQSGLSCLHPGTPVRMADWSVKKISDIKVGDTVLGVNMDGTYAPTKVTRTYNHGRMPMLLSTYRRGASPESWTALVSTGTHKALQCISVTNQFDADVSDNILRILPVGCSGNKVSMSYGGAPTQDIPGTALPEALYLGLMVGAGYYSNSVRRVPNFLCADSSLITDTKDYMESLGIRFVPHKDSQCRWRVVSCNPVDNTGKIRPINLGRELLDKYNMPGKYGYEKEFPQGYTTWSTQTCMDFISGLVSTNGSIAKCSDADYPVISFDSTSLKLLVQLCDMICRHCGVQPPAIHKTGTLSEAQVRKRTHYIVAWTDAVAVLQILRRLKLYGVEEQNRVDAIRELEQATPYLCSMDIQQCGKRIKQAPIGEFTAYDIEVDHPTHLFLLANGLVVSNSKHSGGESVATRRVKRGLEAVDQFINVPKNFVGGAVISDVDGLVNSIKDAPQGGKYITVGGQEHYAPADATVTVKPGQSIESGDPLTDGMVNMAKITAAKGIGQGRKEFVEQLSKLLADNGAGTERKNLESFARGYLSRVEITDPEGLDGWIYGDIADYNVLERNYKPRKSATMRAPKNSHNSYLEQPILHYSIGTRITPRVAADLTANGVNEILVSPEEPQFKPWVSSAKAFQPADEDWITALSGENLMKSLAQHTQRGSDTEKNSTSIYPKLALASGYFPKPLTIQ